MVKETNEDSAWSTIDSIQVVECLDSITTISIKAMKHYSNHDNLSDSDKSEIDFYSKKCAQEYGRGVHLMRSLASNFNAIDYTEFDLNCNNSGVQSSPLTSTDQSFDLKDNDKVVIVPNPNNGEFYITHDTNLKITNYDIYNFQGKLVYSNSGSSRIDQKITLNLPSGIFFIRLNMNDNKTIVKRFVVE